MLTVIATFLTYLATKADDKGWGRVATLFDNLHWKLDNVSSRC